MLRSDAGDKPMHAPMHAGDRIPVYEPELTEADARAAAAAVESGWIAQGPSVERFEAAWAERTGMPHAIAVSNGTAALELAVSALGIGPGDEVICPTFTIVSCVRAIVLAGATPVLVDAEPRTFNPDPREVEAKITARTRAILAVHTYGHPFDPRIVEIARARGLHLIEDAAEAHGAELSIDGKFRPCGGIGDVSIFSFYANKPVTTGEGGMILARDPAVASRARSHRNLCFGPREDRFRHQELGGNFRLGNVAAAIGLSQLARLDDVVERKRRVAALYRARLPHLQFQLHEGWAKPIDWMVAAVFEETARVVSERLERAGVETRPFFLGMHEQPVFQAHFASQSYPVAERLARHGLYLPSSLSVDEAVVERVAQAIG
ncbi:MAG: DegT/DnrJ/EryC1/StrS family aminotransferase [Polyangiales bacterium]